MVDADGLNCLAQREDLTRICALRAAPTLLTPHPGEAARLLNTRIDDIQSNREQAARELAATFNAWVVLKGAGSVLARPDGTTVLNETGNPALSAPGMGDVLTGTAGRVPDPAATLGSLAPRGVAAWPGGGRCGRRTAWPGRADGFGADWVGAAQAERSLNDA